jgi:hypothetical protein
MFTYTLEESLIQTMRDFPQSYIKIMFGYCNLIYFDGKEHSIDPNLLVEMALKGQIKQMPGGYFNLYVLNDKNE